MVSTRCTALVLAAGEARRMGAPKALLELHGVPLVRLHVERARALGYARVLVIVRPALLTSVQALFAHEPYAHAVQVLSHATQSQAGSLAALVRALARVECLSADLTLLVTPVDSLPCSDGTHAALCAALLDGVVAATPCFGARGGHPVLLRASLLAAYLDGPLEACRPLREVLAQAGDRRVRVSVPDPRVVADVDTPADAQALGLRLPEVRTTC